MIVEGIFAFLQKILFFTSFVSGKGTFPKPLPKEDEQKYMEMARGGNEAAKEKLIRHNLRLVAHIVKKYNNAAEVDDMISVGSIGLIKAINTFEYNKGTQLATYAAKCIENEILMYIRSNKKHKSTISLSDSMGKDKEGTDITLMDLLCSSEESIPDQVEHGIIFGKVKDAIHHVLDERELEIVAERYGIYTSQCLTQREVAKKMGISRSYISRIEKRALGKVREYLHMDE